MALIMTGFIAVASAWAREVRMQTTVNLTDRSDPAVKQAVKEAFDISLRGAVAMGFAQIRIDGIQILNDALVLATVATDENDDDEGPDNARDQ
jgi:Na+/H+-translocating membrane pyrophosphatase